MINKENVYSYYDQTKVARINIVLLLFDWHITNKFCSNLQYSLSIRSKNMFAFPKYVKKHKLRYISYYKHFKDIRP